MERTGKASTESTQACDTQGCDTHGCDTQGCGCHERRGPPAVLAASLPADLARIRRHVMGEDNAAIVLHPRLLHKPARDAPQTVHPPTPTVRAPCGRPRMAHRPHQAHQDTTQPPTRAPWLDEATVACVAPRPTPRPQRNVPLIPQLDLSLVSAVLLHTRARMHIAK